MSSRETLFGDIPNDWTLATIGDIAELRQGLQISKELRISEKKDGYIPLLKITDLPKKVFSEYVTDIKEQYIANYNDIIYTRTGQVGLVYTDTEGCIHNNCFKVIVDFNHFDKYFIYYYLKSNKVFNYSNSVASGSVQKDLKHSAFKSCVIGYPNIVEQRSIGHILSTLDDKIEVNNQINKTLENMAQAIFKQWFVDFEFPNEDGEPYKSSGGEMVESELGMIPKGWEVGKLEDIATIVMGQSPKGTSYNEEGEGEVFYQGRTDFSSRFPVRRLFTTEPKRMANEGDVLMSVRAPVGDLNVANERCCIGRGLSAISSSADLSSYILYVMHDLRERLNVYNGEGTVFGSINQKDLKSLKVISSNDNRAEMAFDELIQPIDRMIRSNEDETRRLINLRDSLLPKLMSGEIRVPLDSEGDAS